MRLFFIYICFGIQVSVFGQNSTDKAVDYWLQYQEDETNLESFIEDLETHSIQPLLINSVNLEELERFPLFHQRHLNVIRKYLKQNDNILSWKELENLAYFTPDFVRIIQPFIQLTPIKLQPKSRFKILTRLNTPFQQTSGDSTKLGPLFQNLIQIKGNVKNSKFGFTWEKDRNEPFHYKYNLFKLAYQIQPNGIIDQINLGSFSLNIGSGLIHSNSFLQTQNNTLSELKTNLTSNEYNYSNGIAIVLKYKNVKSLLAFHHKSIDGDIENDTIPQVKKDGLFDSKSELNKRRIASENFTLMSNQIKHKNLKLSLNHKLYHRSNPYSPTYKYYHPNQDLEPIIFNNSLAYQYRIRSFSLFGETANFKNKLASTFFFNYEASDNVYIKSNVRWFSSGYHSQHSSTTQHNSTISDEKGASLLVGWQDYKNQFSIQSDIYQHALPKFQNHLASFGRISEIQYTYTPSDSLRIKLRYRFKTQTKDKTNALLDQRIQTKQHQFSSQFKFKPLPFLILTTQLNWNSNPNSSGYLIAQDFKFTRDKTSYLAGRLSIVNSPDWNNRFYLYEADVLYAFSIPVYHKQAFKTYVLYNYNFNQHWNFWCKYSFVIYPKEESLGSGKQTINTNYKSNMKWQVQFTF